MSTIHIATVPVVDKTISSEVRRLAALIHTKHMTDAAKYASEMYRNYNGRVLRPRRHAQAIKTYRSWVLSTMRAWLADPDLDDWVRWDGPTIYNPPFKSMRFILQCILKHDKAKPAPMLTNMDNWLIIVCPNGGGHKAAVPVSIRDGEKVIKMLMYLDSTTSCCFRVIEPASEE